MAHRSLTVSKTSRGGGTPAAGGPTKTMSTKTPNRQDTFDGTRRLGIDGRGLEHRWHLYERTVYVLDNGDVVHAEHIGDGALTDWIEWVREYRGGWDTLYYSYAPFEGVSTQ